MHTTRIIKSFALAASLTAGITLVAGWQGAFAGQSIQTIDHRTNPTGAGPNRSGVTTPNVRDNQTFAPTGKDGSGKKILWSPTIHDKNGEETYSFFSGKVVIGTAKDGSNIYSDYRTTGKTSLRFNKDGSEDFVRARVKDGETQAKVQRYKDPKTARHIDLGSCPFWGCL